MQVWAGFFWVALLYMQAQFHRIAPVSLAADLTQSFQLSATALGWLAATYFWIYTVLQIPAGILVDRWGPRRLIVGGGVLAALGTLGFALAQDFVGLLVGRIVLSIGVAGFFIAFLKYLSLNFAPRRFATLTGFVVLLGNAGALLATWPLAFALEYVDRRILFMGLAGFTLLMTLGAQYQLKGVLPAPHRHENSALGGLWQVLRLPASWWPFMACGGLAGSFLAFAGLWLGPWLRDVQGLSAAAAGLEGMFLVAGFAVGSLWTGWLADRLQQRVLILRFWSGFYVLSWLLLIWGPVHEPVWRTAVLLLLGGSVSGFTLTWSLVKNLHSPRLAGTATSFVNAAAFGVVGLLQPILGAVLDHWGRNPLAYQWALGLLLLCAVLGFLGSLACREAEPNPTSKSTPARP